MLATEKNAHRFKLDHIHLYNLILCGLVTGIIGARLVFVVQNFAAFFNSPLDILALNTQMLDPLGGLVVAGLAGMIYGQRKRLPLWATLDALTPGLAVMMVMIQLANLSSGDAYGSPTNLPWGIYLWGELRHPVQILEFSGAILIAIFIWRKVSRQSQELEHMPAGYFFLDFLIMASFSRLFFEIFRGDGQLLPGNAHLAQVICWALILTAYFVKQSRSKAATPNR